MTLEEAIDYYRSELEHRQETDNEGINWTPEAVCLERCRQSKNGGWRLMGADPDYPIADVWEDDGEIIVYAGACAGPWTPPIPWSELVGKRT